MSDVVVIGAGISGLICARVLHEAGYKVVVVDKSRGVGGRVATRRLHGTRADHGACYVKAEGELLQLVEVLRDRGILQVWTDTVYEMDAADSSLTLVEGKRYPRYAALEGMSAIAKFLSEGLEIRLNQRVQAITPTDVNTWHFAFDATDETPRELTTQAVVVAIPAPQALMLFPPQTSLPPTFLESLRSVEFDPCLSLMAGYPEERKQDLAKLNPSWKAITLHHCELAWIGLDSSKRSDSQSPVFVLHSSAEFAKRYLDAEDLTSAAHQMLFRAAQLLIPWLDTPDWFQIHRWRYAFTSCLLERDCLDAATPIPLVCCGDWCGGDRIEGAMRSGLAAAVRIERQLQQLSLPKFGF